MNVNSQEVCSNNFHMLFSTERREVVNVLRIVILISHHTFFGVSHYTQCNDFAN